MNNGPLPALILSKDRACQCDLLLRSLARNLKGIFFPYVIWRATSADFARGYDRLRMDHPLVHFVEENSLGIRSFFLRGLEWASSFCPIPLVGLFTDDTVAYRRLDCGSDSIVGSLAQEDVLCFSLRLGENTTVQDYATGRVQPPLQTPEYLGEVVRWSWKAHHWTDNYGYPLSLDGVVYRVADLLEMTRALPFDCLRTWEGVLSGWEHRQQIPRKRMCSFRESVCVNVPANTVQDPPIPSGRFHPVSPQELNERFLRGEIIDLQALQGDFGVVVGAHQEAPYRFCQRGDSQTHGE